MSYLNALPYRIRVPGYDSIDSRGVVSISIKLLGILRVDDERVSLEWSASKQIELDPTLLG